jgi:hypothetical protein
MAALALVVATSFAVGRAVPAFVTAQTPETTQVTEAEQVKASEAERAKSQLDYPDPKPSGTTIPSIELNLVIAGLGPEGCDVEIKPANASCKFRPVYGKRGESRQHVANEGRAKLELCDVELRGADRTCAVAITVREPKQTARTFYRGFRLAPKPDTSATAKPASGPAFTCYLSSPSKLARGDEARTRK